MYTCGVGTHGFSDTIAEVQPPPCRRGRLGAHTCVSAGELPAVAAAAARFCYSPYHATKTHRHSQM